MSVKKWTTTEVVEWMKGLPVALASECYEEFQNQGINGSRLIALGHQGLMNLKVTALGHRECLLSAIQQLLTTIYSHHSDHCLSLANDVMTRSSQLSQYLCKTYGITSLLPVQTEAECRSPVAEVFRRNGSDSDCLRGWSVTTGAAPRRAPLSESTVHSNVCDLTEACRHLILWLDRSSVSEYVVDFTAFRHAFLLAAHQITSMFKDQEAYAKQIVSKCSVLHRLARSVKDCLPGTPLGNVEPQTVKICLAAPNSHPKGWGFSVKCSSNRPMINSILDGTPASSHDGLKTKDELLEVSGISVTGWALDNITKRLREVSKSHALSLAVLRDVITSHDSFSVASRITLIPENLESETDTTVTKTTGLPSNSGTSLSENDDRDAMVSVIKRKHASGSNSGTPQTTAKVLHMPLCSTPSDIAALRNDEGSSSDAHSKDEDEDAATNGITDSPRGIRFKGSSSDGVTTSVSDSAVGSQHKKVSNQKSDPTTVLEFGYRTQIVGGVVMRIPVNDTRKSIRGTKKAPKVGKWTSILGSKHKKTSEDASATSVVNGDAASKIASEDDISSWSPQLSHSSSPRGKAERKTPRGRVKTTDSLTMSSTDNSPTHKKDTPSKRRTSLGSIGPGLSRMLDKETTVGDVNVPAAGLHHPQCTGWMTKQGNVNKNWKRRWFVLKDLCLYYYRTPNDKQALNAIPLPSYSVEMAQDSKKSFALRVIHKNARTFLMYCDTFEDMMMWIDAINDACQGLVKCAQRDHACGDAETDGASEITTERTLTESTRL